MNIETLEKIKNKIKDVESEGFGEVVIKIKNGAVCRILKTDDELIDKVDK
jgi:hypothetical protein